MTILFFNLFMNILPIGLALSILVFVGWVFHQWFKPQIGFAFSIIGTLIILYLTGTGIPFITTNLTFIQTLWLWDSSEKMSLPFDTLMVNDQLSISMLLFTILLYVLVFLMTSWLFKKKVEV